MDLPRDGEDAAFTLSTPEPGRGELRFFDGSGVSKLDDSFRAREVQTDEGYVVWVRTQGASRELLYAPEPGSAWLALAGLAAAGALSRRTRVPRS